MSTGERVYAAAVPEDTPTVVQQQAKSWTYKASFLQCARPPRLEQLFAPYVGCGPADASSASRVSIAHGSS